MPKLAKKVVRSALVRLPRVYEMLTSQRRYTLLHHLGMVHERDFRRLPELVRSDALLLDVGGNLGQSILSMKRVLPNSTVISFEPNPLCHPALEHLRQRLPGVNYSLLDSRITPHERRCTCPSITGR